MGDLAVLTGRVVPGRQRGRDLGFPTANLEPGGTVARELIGAVYAARARWEEGSWRQAVVNIGARPTFGEGGCSVEVHLLDFGGDLYGRSLEVALVARLRSERRFGDAGELVAQVNKDIVEARAVLAREAGRP